MARRQKRSSLSACGVRLIVMLLITVRVNGFSTAETKKIEYRKGQRRDKVRIATALAKELMNPLSVDIDRFVVASDDDDKIVGWAQIKPLGKAVAERDPKRFNARPGSYDLEQDVDEAMLDEFENDDSIQVPVGLTSLPWTKEYRDMEEAVQQRNKRREELRAQQEKELQTLWELSSVFVEKEYRGQGIGTELVRRVLQRRLVEENDDFCSPANIYLLALATTVDWYRDNFGFEQVAEMEVPAPMAFEVTVGNFITKLIGAQLCCMRGTSKTLELARTKPVTEATTQ